MAENYVSTVPLDELAMQIGMAIFQQTQTGGRYGITAVDYRSLIKPVLESHRPEPTESNGDKDVDWLRNDLETCSGAAVVIVASDGGSDETTFMPVDAVQCCQYDMGSHERYDNHDANLPAHVVPAVCIWPR